MLLEPLVVGLEDRTRRVTGQRQLGIVDLAIISLDLLVETVELPLGIDPVGATVLLRDGVTLTTDTTCGNRNSPGDDTDEGTNDEDRDEPPETEQSDAVGILADTAPLVVRHGHGFSYSHPGLRIPE